MNDRVGSGWYSLSRPDAGHPTSRAAPIPQRRGLGARGLPLGVLNRTPRPKWYVGGLDVSKRKPRRSGLTRARRGPGAVAGGPGRPHCAGSEGSPVAGKEKPQPERGPAGASFVLSARASSTKPSHGHFTPNSLRESTAAQATGRSSLASVAPEVLEPIQPNSVYRTVCWTLRLRGA
jgi:hypothetical protein